MEEVHNQPAHSRMKPSKAARVEFNDRLIAEVQKRPVLRDCCRPDYKDQRKKMTAWEEVAAECGRDPDELLKKDEDEEAMFGQVVAHKLRSFSKRMRTTLQIEILEVFSRHICE
ncbi:hypothetical protein HPB49_022331 [Dermacentor silvarum]|uniref:Uncharacterized protein n=1 Tax=Dermacentor silvarum TaxID=543639 RepID=A0ACB8DKU5_DERSI|nr:hypothetical protein HPB49_022331 [Dermacentor silvarum]